ncbi:MAG: hypothetical protein KKA73_26710 [Chloroflexi bacterium]|nr:hypothetical protein [Chloroflexota bacterium]MBU1751293.1 hypothetical protein [Chloroflexota bacterium]
MGRALNEAIEMRERQYGYFPSEFRWRGQVWRVEHVEQCWTESERTWRHTVQRHCFRVRCDNGRRFQLYQNVQGNTWHVAPQAR